jgi:predicted dehydrogenase
MQSSCNIGIVGCGVIAPTHAECFAGEERAKMRWACDIVEEKARRLADRFGIPNVTTDYHDVLADPAVDAISICTPHASHGRIAVDALAAGKHVQCEKALAATREQMSEMLAAHRRHPGFVFACVFQHRFNRLYQAIKKLIEDGAFGQVLTAGMQMRCFRSEGYYTADAWRGTWAEEGGSVLINQAIHTIDILAWMLGGVEAVCGTYSNQTHTNSIETEDAAVASLRFRNGALGTIEATSSSHLDWEPTVFVHGTDGSLEVRDGTPTKIIFRTPEQTESVRAALQSAPEKAELSAAKAYYGGEHRSQIADFVDAVCEDRDPFITAESGRHAVDIVLAVYDAHRQGGWVAL